MDEDTKCPKCGSSDLGGLMESFFVPLDPNSEPKGAWHEWSSETELGADRCCYQCGWTSLDDDSERDRIDAERYRVIRDNDRFRIFFNTGDGDRTVSGERLDDAVDRLRGESNEGG